MGAFFTVELTMQDYSDVDNQYLRRLKGEITAFFNDEDVKIVLFGSRARGDNHPAADVDIGIIPSGEMDNTKIALLNEFRNYAQL